jgi:parallel beta-helix repeat protein
LDNLYGLHIGSNSNYNTISNNNIQNNFGGIILRYCNNSTIFENKITNNIRGIHLEFSNSSNIMTNNVRSNHHYGIGLCSSSKNNILGNNISLSDNHGVYQHHSCSNTFSSNNIGSNNDYGVCLYHLSDNNLFYHNNFINNNRSAYDGCTNIWNNGYPYGGNYWSDYVGYDNYYGPNQNISGADNIGDTPYPIHGGSNNDNYPLMKPWGFLLEGYCYYEDMNPADKITVRITNMDSGRKWHAGTINNYYSFVFAPGEDINASETLQIIAKDSAHYKGVVNHKFKEIESVNTINITIDLVPGDVDFDGDVDLSDLAQLLAYYGITTGATYEQGDVDGDGDVDLADLAALLANYGTGI